jgi:hypothetical protein
MMEWKPMQTEMSHHQKKQLSKISFFLVSNPGLHLTISQDYFEDHEKEMILLFEAKKKFYISRHHTNAGSLSEDDSTVIANMSIKDSAFVHYLSNNADPYEKEFSVLEKCRMLIGQSKIDTKYSEMIASRKKGTMDFFSDEQQTDRVTYEHAVNSIPRSGFSHDIFRYQ